MCQKNLQDLQARSARAWLSRFRAFSCRLLKTTTVTRLFRFMSFSLEVIFSTGATIANFFALNSAREQDERMFFGKLAISRAWFILQWNHIMIILRKRIKTQFYCVTVQISSEPIVLISFFSVKLNLVHVSFTHLRITSWCIKAEKIMKSWGQLLIPYQET